MGVSHPHFGTFCAICFKQLKKEDCVKDKDGQLWDICKGDCAKQAGIEEEDYENRNHD